MELKLNLTTKWRDVVEKCYATDNDLLHKFHILAPTTLGDAVDHTVNTFIKCAETSKFDMYEIMDDDVFVGYVGIEIFTQPPVGKIMAMTGFFIMPEYRGVKAEVFELIRTLFPNKKILTSLFSKNSRGIKALTNQGGSIFATDKTLVDGVGDVEYVVIIL